MKKKIIYGIATVILAVSLVAYNQLQTAQAQQPQQSNVKAFTFAKNFQDYLNDNGASFAASFPQDIIILNWDTLPVNVQNGIRTQANLAGYSECLTCG